MLLPVLGASTSPPGGRYACDALAYSKRRLTVLGNTRAGLLLGYQAGLISTGKRRSRAGFADLEEMEARTELPILEPLTLTQEEPGPRCQQLAERTPHGCAGVPLQPRRDTWVVQTSESRQYAHMAMLENLGNGSSIAGTYSACCPHAL